ncbi:hypothetical protein DCMF_20910 [Candidatus Formimonas warabiya]|uniref:Glycosyltransferase family 4 protein n=2 Tax=Formimonas warabiya TaxID=1761012 RepID=A0A3G1L2U4_FORW1|nr:hypothetical protein DCMF_20910 [Candidatus Formimonas warabiya]
MPRILQVLCQKPGKTGSGIFLLALADLGAKKGHEQAVIAGVSREEAGMYQECLGQKSAFFPVQFQTEMLPFPIVGMSDVMPYPSTRYRDLSDDMFHRWCRAFQVTLAKAMDSFQPDLILSHHLWLLTSLTRRTVQNIPVVGICHGTCLRQLALAEQFASYAIEGCRTLDGVFALNNFQKKAIGEDYGIEEDRIAVTGAGYHSHIFYRDPEKIPGTTIKLVYAGKLSLSKGVHSLIKVYRRLYQRGLAVELHLVGSGSGNEEGQIREMAQATGGKIFFYGAVSQEQLGDIFRHCDIFILPSFYEGLSLVLMEALASGLRAVTTDLPGIKEYLGEVINCSGLVKYVELPRLKDVDIPLEEDLPDFEERLYETVKEQILAGEDGAVWEDEEIKQAVADLSWEGVYQKMEDFYTKFL